MTARVPAITGLGLVTPVGLSVASSCAAFRAAVARLGPVHGHLVDDESGDPVAAVGGRVPLEWFDGGPQEDEYPGHEAWGLKPPPPSHAWVSPGAERLTELSIPAADEAWREARLADRAPRSIGLYLGLDDRDRAEPTAGAIADALGASFAIVRADRLGRAAGLAALHRAARHLREERVEVALVGGVDSLVRPESIERLADAGTLKTEDNPTGVAPGEAAAFVVLEAEPPRGVAPLAYLEGTGIAEEPTTGTDDANEGVGLTAAVRAAREAAGGGPEHFPRVVCDLNGDRYRAMEWAYAHIRSLQDLGSAPDGPAETERWHPAECTGDTGAASGLLNLIWSVTAMRRGYAGIGVTLVWGASDGPLRAAVLVARDPSR